MEQAQTNTSRSISIINLILGAWLVVSPYFMGYQTGQSMWNQTIFGVIIALFAIWRLAAPMAHWASWINVISAVWLIIAPFTLGYTADAAFWNEIVVAIIVGALAITNASMPTNQRIHHSAV